MLFRSVAPERSADSAIRWRRNDVGGFYKEIVVCGQFAESRQPQLLPGFDRGAGDILVPKPAGRVFASLRGAGLRLARLMRVFSSISRGHPEHLFS